ncbi:MAG: ROK family protein [Polyangiaceae bacterium]|nr:ROK family protein [Polyangiaceae bacterium]
MSDVAIGVDLGGTKTEVVALRLGTTGEPDILVRERVATPRDEGYEAVLAATAEIVRAACTRAGVDVATVPIGVGMPGGLERRTGHVKNSNTTCLNGRPFRTDLETMIGRRIAFDNDANCFALAETRFGATRAYADGIVFGVILGTGVGGGLVVRGSVWPGPQGIAGEWGHHAVYAGAPDARPCYCGARGCLETYASGSALERRYEDITGTRLSLATIAKQVDTDPAAARVVEELVDAFGRGLANVVDILDPSAIVLGGGVSNLAVLYGAGRERVARYVFNDELVTPIVRHVLGDSAGVLGAALLPLGVPTIVES